MGERKARQASAVSAQSCAFLLNQRQRECEGDEHSREKLEVVRRHAHFEHEGNNETINDGTQNDGNQARFKRLRRKKHFADDD